MAANEEVGRLSIGVYGDTAPLEQSMQNAERTVRGAAGQMAAAFSPVEQAVAESGKSFRQLDRAAQQLKDRIDPLAPAMRTFDQELKTANALLQTGRISQEQYGQAVDFAKEKVQLAEQRLSSFDRQQQVVTASAGAQRAGMQQLGFQLQDFAVQTAGGTSAFRAFSQQFPQALGAVTLMTGGTSKLGAFLGGPWGIALGVAAASLVPLIGKLFETANAADTASGALQNLINKRLEEQKGQFDLARAEQQVQTLYGKRAALIEKIAAAEAILARNADSARAEGVARLRRQLAEANFNIATSEDAIRGARDSGAKEDQQYVEQAIANRAKLLGATTAVERAQAQYNLRIAESQRAWDKSDKSAEDQERLLQARTRAELDLNRAQEAASAATRAVSAAERERNKGLRESEAAAKQAAQQYANLIDGVQRQIAGLKTQTEALGMADDAAQLLTNQQKLLSDAQAKGTRITEMQRHSLMGLAEDLTEAEIALRKAQNLKGANDNFDAQSRSLAQAAERTGIYGRALAELTTYQTLLNTATNNGRDAIDDLTDAQLRGKAAKVADAVAAGQNSEFIEGLITNTEALQRAMEAERGELGLSGAALHAYRFEQQALNEAAQKHIDLTPEQIAAIRETAEAFGGMRAEIDRDREAILQLDQQIGALIGTMSRMGGIGGLFGDVAGVLTSSNPIASLLGMGGVGTLLGIGFGGNEPFEKLAKDFEDTLRGTFGVNGQFADMLGNTLGSVFQGAAIGGPVGGILGGGKGGALGGQLGGALGGALGTAAGTAASAAVAAGTAGAAGTFIASLGSFAGPLGAIAGAVIGNVLGSALQSTPRGKATFSGLDYSLSGNSAAREDAAGQLAGQVLGGLQQLAETLGGTIEGLTGTIGIRKDSLRYDPTGQGITKTSKGAQQYADEGALIAAVIADQIAKGVIKGLSPQSEALLKGPGPIEERIAKAQAFEAALGQLAETLDPAGAALKAFDAQAKALRDLFAEAGATTQQTAELEAALAKDRLEIEQQYAEEAEANARGLAQKRIELLEAEGKAEEARAAARTLYLEDLDAEEAAIQQQIWAALDLAEARAKQEQADREVAEALAAQEAVTKRLADEILALEDPQAARIQQLAEEKAGLTESQAAMVDRREALREQAEADRLAAEAAEREAETTARLQAEILALESPEAARIAQLNEEKAALTGAQKAMVDRREALIRQGEADRALADANEQRVDWRIRRARALGDEETALALTMEQVLRSVPALNRAYAEQTLLAEQAAAAVEKAAATQQRIANLQLQALSALDPAAGKVVSRNRTLADIDDPAEREAQRQVYLAEDAAAAREADARAAGQRAAGRAAAAQGIETALGAARQAQAQQAQQLADAEAQLARGREEAGSRLQAAWERETGAFAETAERWRGIATDLRSASAELRLGAPGGAEAARALQVRFLATAGQAQAGDADAAQQLVGLGDRFLEAALPRARNAEDAARLMDFVARSYDEAALTGDRMVDFNNAQIELLNRQVDGVVDLGGKVDTVAGLLGELGDEFRAYRVEQEAANLAIARNTRKQAESFDRVSAGGTAIFTQPAASEEA